MSSIGRGKLRKIIDSLIVEASITREWTPFYSRQRGNYFRVWVNDNISPAEIETALAGFPEKTLDRSGSHTNSYIRKAWQVFGEEFLDDLASASQADVVPSTTWPFPAPGTPEGRDAVDYWRELSLQDRRVLSNMTRTFSSVLQKLSGYLIGQREGGGGTVYPTEMRAVPPDWGFGGRHHPNALPGVYSYFSYADSASQNFGKYWVVYGNWRPGETLRFYLYTATTNGTGSTFIRDAMSDRPLISFEATGKSGGEIASTLGSSIVEDMGLGLPEEESEDQLGDDREVDRTVDLASVEP